MKVAIVFLAVVCCVFAGKEKSKAEQFAIDTCGDKTIFHVSECSFLCGITLNPFTLLENIHHVPHHTPCKMAVVGTEGTCSNLGLCLPIDFTIE